MYPPVQPPGFIKIESLFEYSQNFRLPYIASYPEKLDSRLTRERKDMKHVDVGTAILNLSIYQCSVVLDLLSLRIQLEPLHRDAASFLFEHASRLGEVVLSIVL